jgi:hypothetical protein
MLDDLEIRLVVKVVLAVLDLEVVELDEIPGTEEVELPDDEIVPVNLISRELAPTYILKAPVGMTHF